MGDDKKNFRSRATDNASGEVVALPAPYRSFAVTSRYQYYAQSMVGLYYCTLALLDLVHLM